MESAGRIAQGIGRLLLMNALRLGVKPTDSHTRSLGPSGGRHVPWLVGDPTSPLPLLFGLPPQKSSSGTGKKGGAGDFEGLLNRWGMEADDRYFFGSSGNECGLGPSATGFYCTRSQ
jgi:hypothetical protein